MRYFLAVSLLAFLTNVRAAEPAAEPLHDGKTLAGWSHELANTDVNTRIRAARAMWYLGPKAKALPPELVRALKDDDFRVRLTAVKALERFGVASVPALLDAIASDELNATARLAFRALGRTAVPKLLRGLGSESAATRAASAAALGWAGSRAPEVAAALEKAAKDADAHVRVQAAGSLRLLKPNTEVGVDGLLDAMRDKNENIRRQAAEFLGVGKSPRARQALQTATHDPALRVRVNAAMALCRVDPSQASSLVSVLLEGLKGDNAKDFQSALQITSKLAAASKPSLPILIEAVKKPDPLIATPALLELAKVGQDNPAAVAVTQAALRHPHPQVRMAACQTLSRLAAKDSATRTALVGALRDSDPSVRYIAAIVLGSPGMKSETLLPVLITALKDSDPRVRQGAAEAVLAINPHQSAAAPVLVELLGSGEEAVRRKAGDLLKRIGAPAVPSLVAALSDSRGERRSAAAATLGSLGLAASAAVPALTKALADKEINVRVEAAIALSQLKEVAPGLAAVLVEGLKHENLETRQKAAIGLSQLGPKAKAAVPALAELMEKSSNSAVRQAIATALGSLGPDARAGVPALRSALNDSDPQVRLQVADALLAIGDAGEKKLVEQAVGALVALLRESNRTLVLRTIATLQKAGPAGVAGLVQALQHADDTTRREAAAALSRLANTPRTAIRQPLLDALKDKSPAVRRAAAVSLLRVDGDNGASAKAASAILTDALKTGDTAARREALTGLTMLVRRPATRQHLTPLVPAIVTALSDPEANVRSQAATILTVGRLKDPSMLPSLIAIVKDKKHPSRLPAAQVLAQFGPQAKEAVPSLLEMLRDKGNADRMTAVRILPSVGKGDPQVVAALRNVFQEKGNLQLRMAAGYALGLMKEDAKPAIPVLTAALREDNTQIRDLAITVLDRIGANPDEYLGPLVEILGQPEGATARPPAQITSIVQKHGSTLVPGLSRLLKDASAERRAGAARCLGAIGTKAAETAPELKRLLGDNGPWVRIRAAQALWRVSGKADASVPVLIEAIKNADPQIQRSAAVALGGIGAGAKDAVKPLTAALGAHDDTIIQAAAYALGAIGSEASSAVPALVDVAKGSGARGNRQLAITALGQIGVDAKAALPALYELLQDRTGLSDPAAAAVAKIGASTPEAASALIAALKVQDETHVGVMAQALSKLDAAAVPAIAALLKEPHTSLRQSGAEILGAMGSKAAKAATSLKPLLNDEEQAVAVQAAAALWLVAKDASGLPSLIQAIRARDKRVRLRAIAGLQAMGPRAKEAVPALLGLANDPDQQVRRGATAALKEIDPEVLKRLGDR